jgi:hypothetical protein
MVELVAFKDEKEAATIKTLLESNNIKVNVIFSPTWTYGGGAQPLAQGTGMIYVPEEDVKKAMSIIEEHEGKEIETERFPIPIETPEDKLAGQIRRLRVIASYKKMFWPGVVMIVCGGLASIKGFRGTSDEFLKYTLIFFGLVVFVEGIAFLISGEQANKAEKELQIKEKDLKDHS